MTSLIGWIKTHKLAVILTAIILYLLFSRPIQFAGISSRSSAPMLLTQEFDVARDSVAMPSVEMGKMSGSSIGRPAVAPTDTLDRKVITDTSLSLKVNNVEESITQIQSIATTMGGHLVDSNISIPDGASTGTITVRVPTDRRSEALTQFKATGVKTVMEHVSGQDVTDQFVDNTERLRILESTKVKFETILNSANTVQEMLNVQRELLSLQQQIDSIKGQQQYLEGSAKLSRISLYLSTDELALPYAPDSSWRPELVFKEAVRSMILNVRHILNVLIWLAVYAPVLVVLGIVLIIGRRMLKNKNL